MKESRFFRQAAMMVRVLPSVASEACFALKGGTAINLFVRDLPRLSVDIDLAYLPLSSRAEALEDIRSALERIEARAKRQMPHLAVLSRGTLDSPKRLFRVDDVPIKIEPNPVLRGTVFPTETRRLAAEAERLFERAVEVPLVSRADLYGGKLCAALDRSHPRDWFDVHMLIEAEGLSSEVRQALVVYIASHRAPMAELLDPRSQSMAQVFDKEFAGMARIPVDLQVLENVRDRVPSLIRDGLTADERTFLLSIKLGEPDWSRLPMAHLDALPALRWKLQNVERLKESPKRYRQSVERLRKVLDL